MCFKLVLAQTAALLIRLGTKSRVSQLCMSCMLLIARVPLVRTTAIRGSHAAHLHAKRFTSCCVADADRPHSERNTNATIS